MPQQIARPVFQVSVVAIALFQVAALFARSMLEASLISGGHTNAFAADLSYLVVPPILLVLMYPYLRQNKDRLLDLLRFSDLTLRVVAFSILLGLSLRITRWAILTLLIALGALGNDGPHGIADPIVAFACPSLPILLLSFGVMAIAVPIIEEVVNRGFTLHALLPRGTVTSIIVSAFIFAALHDPGSYPLTFVIGLLLAVQVLNYRTLWAPMLTHATYNALAVVDWECFRITWHSSAPESPSSILTAVSVTACLAGICASAYLVSRKAAGACDAPRRT